MRGVLSILLILTTLNCYSQDTIKVPQLELDEFFAALDTIKQQDSLKSILIDSYELQLKNYNLLSSQDSLIISYKNLEIGLLKDQVKTYDYRLKQVDKWYKKPWIGVVSGIAITLFTIHIIDYSLPK
jgi:hypothetical protein